MFIDLSKGDMCEGCFPNMDFMISLKINLKEFSSFVIYFDHNGFYLLRIFIKYSLLCASGHGGWLACHWLRSYADCSTCIKYVG